MGRQRRRNEVTALDQQRQAVVADHLVTPNEALGDAQRRTVSGYAVRLAETAAHRRPGRPSALPT